MKNALLDWTTYTYDEMGQIVSMTDAELHTTRYEYDKLGRRIATILPMTQRLGMTYDEVGNVKTTTDFNGKTIAYRYDERDRLIEKSFEDGSKVQYGYTRNSLQDTVTFRDSAGLITSFYDYDYDVRDRLVKRTDVLGTGVSQTTRAIEYGYDAASNQTSVKTASGTTTYSYDERNRLDLVKLNGVLQADYDYDAASRLVKTTFGNNTEEVRIYDTLNRLKELTSKRTTDNVLLSKYVYTLDKVGNRKTATETLNGQSRSLVYTYDDLYRLREEAITDVTNGNRISSYDYDAVGNRRSKTINGVKTVYAYDANDRLLNEKVNGVITTSYSYDNNGSTLTKTENGVTTTYTWNDEKRLVSVTVGNTQQVEYTYNDQGIRVSSKVNGVETRYLLDEGITANVWEEYSPNGSIQASYVYGRDLITQTQGIQTSYYLVDGLGSTRLLTDTQGRVLNSYGYEAFGEKINQSGSTDNKYQYAGEQFDAVLGDYYLRQRFYDTSSGRFGRMDTYEGRSNQPLTMHKYIYANNNSITNIDPSGYFSITLSEYIAILAAVAVFAAGVYQATTSGRQGVRLEEAERLPGFNEGAKPMGVLANFFRWRDSWKLPPLPGFGDKSVAIGPSHTGHTGASINNLVQYVFNVNYYVAYDIAHGHSWSDPRHNLDWQRLGITNELELAERLDKIMKSPSASETLEGGRTKYWDHVDKIIIIVDPSNEKEGGTAFVPDNGKAYYDTVD